MTSFFGCCGLGYLGRAAAIKIPRMLSILPSMLCMPEIAVSRAPTRCVHDTWAAFARDAVQLVLLQAHACGALSPALASDIAHITMYTSVVAIAGPI